MLFEADFRSSICRHTQKPIEARLMGLSQAMWKLRRLNLVGTLPWLDDDVLRHFAQGLVSGLDEPPDADTERSRIVRSCGMVAHARAIHG